jgi:hypothetical protein
MARVGGRALAATAIGLLALGATVVTQRIDLALSGAHSPTDYAGSVGDLASPMRVLTPKVSVDVASGWVNYSDTVSAESLPARSVDALTLAYLGADLLLMFSLTALLLLAQQALQPEPARLQSRGPAAAQDVLRWSWVPTLLYLVFDLLETLGATQAWRSVADDGTGVARFIGIASLAKWFFLAAALLGMGVWLAYHRRDRMRSATVVPPTKALRGQLLVAGFIVVFLLGLSGDLGRQIDDVLVRAADVGGPAVLATLLMLATCIALFVGGSQCLHAYERAPTITPVTGRLRWWVLGWLGVAAALAGVALALGARATAISFGVLAGALLIWWLLSWPRPIRDFTPVEPDTREEGPEEIDGPVPDAGAVTGTRLLLAVLTAVPAVALYLATVGAATSQWAGTGAPVLLVLWSVVALMLSGVVLWLGVSLRDIEAEDWAPRQLALPLGGVVLGSALLALAPVGLWTEVGVPAVVFLFTTVLATVVALLVLMSDALAPRGPLALLCLRRMPLIALLVLWGVIASVLDKDGTYYDARVIDGDVAAIAQTPTQAYIAWQNLQRRAVRDASPADAAATERPVVPLVFVASAGGGIRAAYWTSKTWDCVFATACGGTVDHTNDVFFASGVSGGAVGLAEVRARQLDEVSGDVAAGTTTDIGSSWVDSALGEDFLAPAAAALVFRDLPNAVLRVPVEGDRAATLERAFEAAHPTMSSDFAASRSRFPQLAFSGTSVEDGCRLSVSLVRQGNGSDAVCTGSDTLLPQAGPGSDPARDAADYVCDDEGNAASMRLSTAAVLSARFPVVSSSGGLGPCGEGSATYSLDGGLFDNSAGSAVTAAWTAVADRVAEANRLRKICVVPRLLVIDSHYSSLAATDPTARPQQTLAPLDAALGVYGNRNSRALAEATRLIEEAARTAATDCGDPSLGDDAVAQIYPRASTAPQPPLGWTLAESTRQNLTEQLFAGCPAEGSPHPGADEAESRPNDNCAAVRQVQSWFGASTGGAG